MLKFSADLKVDRPVEKVFAWLTNADNQAKFDKSSLKMELLTPGPWRAGSQFKELRDLGGRKTEVLSEISELEPDRRFVIRSKTGPGWLGTWIFEPEGDGTRLHWTGQLTMGGFARLLEPLIGKQMRPQIARQFAELPGLIEGEITVPSTASLP
jgi:carbon monoxide dehydrogenase subunit G